MLSRHSENKRSAIIQNKPEKLINSKPFIFIMEKTKQEKKTKCKNTLKKCFIMFHDNEPKEIVK